ncbi:hypothetical protein M0811_02511 [Anaeramoeba ignava]|uniref:Tetratricopeptide repeat protein n=1 Tax=Anaeramoeba ignava TaxID=1746090 RepID=A0A9Q0LA28_ANAIG|nr:hypothetical protein M0811_02511 [Anaeramoeba ignava]
MKIYIHYEESKPEFTFILNLSNEKIFTIENALKVFVEKYNEVNKKNLEMNNLRIIDQKGKEIRSHSIISKILNNGEDVFVVKKKIIPSKVVIHKTEKPKPNQENTTNQEKPKPKINKKKEVNKPNEILEQGILNAKKIKNKQYGFKEALEIFKTLHNNFPKSTVCLFEIADIYYQVKRYSLAREYFGKLFELEPHNWSVYYKICRCFYKESKNPEAFEMCKNLIANIQENEKQIDILNDSYVLFGKILQKRNMNNDSEIAFSLFVQVLTKNDSHLNALAEYALCLSEKGNDSEAVHVALRSIVLNQSHKKTRRTLSKVVKGNQGIEYIKKELSPLDQKLGEMFAFLAVIMKDYGSINESTLLFKQAFIFQKQSINLALNILHILEIQNNYQEAFEFAISYCEQNPTKGLQSVSCGEICEMLKNIKENKEFEFKEKLDVKETKSQIEYDKMDLDLLAFWFTIIKFLFINRYCKSLKSLSSLINLALPKQELHKTIIRNEAAYFSCIYGVLKTLSFDNLSDYPPIYVVGDSHILPISWNTINFEGQKRILFPKLITGLKIWHLRKKSCFYPKRNFEKVIPTIPNNSDLIFILGEIDTRSILFTIENCYYDNLDQGLRVLAHIYISILLNLIKQHNFRIFVHPIPPVLDQTRSVVKDFNQILKQSIPIYKNPKLLWLDFFDQLLSHDRKNLLPEFQFDEAHLNPKYISLIEKSLELKTKN